MGQTRGRAEVFSLTESSTTVICVCRITSARSTIALHCWLVASSADDHGMLVIGMCRAVPRDVSLSHTAPAGRLATATRKRGQKQRKDKNRDVLLHHLAA